MNASEPLPVSERRIASGTSSAGNPVARRQRAQRRGQQIHRPRAAEHADRDENPDQERDDLHADVESFLRAFDEDVVDLDASESGPTSGMRTSSTGIAQSEIASSAARITSAPPPARRRLRVEPLQQLGRDDRRHGAGEGRDERRCR